MPDTVHKGVVEGFTLIDTILKELCKMEGKGGHGMGQYLGQLKDTKIPKGSDLETRLQEIVPVRNLLSQLQEIVPVRNLLSHGGSVSLSADHGYKNLSIIQDLLPLRH